MTTLEKLQSLKPHEIVETMIRGLENAWVNVGLGTTGLSNRGRMYGGASTNFCCEIMGRAFEPKEISYCLNRSWSTGLSEEDQNVLERAIDLLSRGNTWLCNLHLKSLNMAPIENILNLPELKVQTWKKDLDKYKEYAQHLKSQQD